MPNFQLLFSLGLSLIKGIMQAAGSFFFADLLPKENYKIIDNNIVTLLEFTRSHTTSPSSHLVFARPILLGPWSHDVSSVFKGIPTKFEGLGRLFSSF